MSFGEGSGFFRLLPIAFPLLNCAIWFCKKFGDAIAAVFALLVVAMPHIGEYPKPIDFQRSDGSLSRRIFNLLQNGRKTIAKNSRTGYNIRVWLFFYPKVRKKL